ncbi:uncharacterized protein AMSG_01863 [Thecamonas trahens ATCC 50062]|uniref:Uncharacterized protein n=1 Tax=Thecamonas trahens ATCC 50062 TaxID=461836 RepID=A0A0L0DU85_THETB|nr:hypothetical protein AMSG_01863 [Thecamonas trahens ATCC 50062]KNC55596.1 hypothetical protein AMSG_01863 [Thecamonas trahens ATCC 50062]|eukprot:XP_013761369.1 hypothetical protein AMSG_01863 [Thecamonas trahens ATCC 50062]
MASAQAPFATDAAYSPQRWDADRGVAPTPAPGPAAGYSTSYSQHNDNDYDYGQHNDYYAATAAPAPRAAANRAATPPPRTVAVRDAHASSGNPLVWRPAGARDYDPQLDCLETANRQARRTRERRHVPGDDRPAYLTSPYASTEPGFTAPYDVAYVSDRDTTARQAMPEVDYGFGHRSALDAERRMTAADAPNADLWHADHNPLVWAPNSRPDAAARAAQAAELDAARRARTHTRGMRHYAGHDRAPPGSPPHATAPYATEAHNAQAYWDAGMETPSRTVDDSTAGYNSRAASSHGYSVAAALHSQPSSSSSDLVARLQEEQAAAARRQAAQAEEQAARQAPPARPQTAQAAAPRPRSPQELNAFGYPPGPMDRYLVELEKTGPSQYASEFRTYTPSEMVEYSGVAYRHQPLKRYVVDEPTDYRSTYQIMASAVPDPVSHSPRPATAHGAPSEVTARTHKERGSRRAWYDQPGMAGRALVREPNDPPPSEIYVTEAKANFTADALNKPKARSSAPFRNRFKSAASRGPLMI